MAREQTVVTLDKPAREAIAKRMRERGETAATYFSNPAGASVSTVATEAVVPSKTATPFLRKDGTESGISYVKPDMAQTFREAQARVGLRQGMQDAELTMSLYTTPEERRAARIEHRAYDDNTAGLSSAGAASPRVGYPSYAAGTSSAGKERESTVPYVDPYIQQSDRNAARDALTVLNNRLNQRNADAQPTNQLPPDSEIGIWDEFTTNQLRALRAYKRAKPGSAAPTRLGRVAQAAERASGYYVDEVDKLTPWIFKHLAPKKAKQ